mgnify:FL=1
MEGLFANRQRRCHPCASFVGAVRLSGSELLPVAWSHGRADRTKDKRIDVLS